MNLRTNLDLAFVALVSAALLVIALALPVAGLARVMLGLPFLLLFPGYALVAALYPSRTTLDGVERLALSLGLSLAIVPLIGLALNYLPWGIRLVPILAATLLFILAAVFSAACRRARLAAGDAFTLPLDAIWSRWRGMTRVDRALAGLIGLALLGLGCSIFIAANRATGESFSEFYILGPGGAAQDYPRSVALGQRVSMTVGVINQEGEPTSYRVAVTLAGREVASVATPNLGDKGKWEGPVAFTASSVGSHQEVQFLLFKDGGNQPYRRLHIWLDVRAATMLSSSRTAGTATCSVAVPGRGRQWRFAE